MRTENLVLYYPKNFYLIGAVNQKLSALKSSGIIKYFIQNFIDDSMKINSVESGPRELNLKHLEGPFKILLIGYTASTIVMLIEIIYARVFKKFRVARIVTRR